MPAYHSKLNNGEIDFPESCGCALVKFEPNKVNPDDIIGETFAFFRANVFFRNFPVTTSVDRTLIYMTLYLQQCLVKCEKITDKKEASRELSIQAQKPFAIPGEPGFELGSIFSNPKSSKESDSFSSYIKQARAEIGARLCEVLYDGPNGEKNKWWMAFSKKKFMGKEFKN